jgi:hypothetical protein
MDSTKRTLHCQALFRGDLCKKAKIARRAKTAEAKAAAAAEEAAEEKARRKQQKKLQERSRNFITRSRAQDFR